VKQIPSSIYIVEEKAAAEHNHHTEHCITLEATTDGYTALLHTIIK